MAKPNAELTAEAFQSILESGDPEAIADALFELSGDTSPKSEDKDEFSEKPFVGGKRPSYSDTPREDA